MILTKVVYESKTVDADLKAIVYKDDDSTGFDVCLYIDGEYAQGQNVPTLKQANAFALAHISHCSEFLLG